MSREAEGWRAEVSLPDGVPGTLVWGGAEHAVKGKAALRLPL